MMLVDTSVWIDFLTGRDTLHRRLLHRLLENEDDICITEIILTEILQGIKDDAVYETTKNYLMEFPIIKPKGIDSYIKAAEIYRKCRKHGKTVRKTVDCIIAAIAVENKIILFHNDVDFEVIKGYADLKTVDVRRFLIDI
ncbi:MAG: PIN domain nuclease [Nitrospinae bacterium]|nr:PIN domain nuclease [Nitrospinota bacterium]MBI3813229.1 PIN domain nuclease [Nitrospinota bacterium]